MAVTNRRLAVFIDCANASPVIGPKVLARMPQPANPSVKRAYGNAASLESWSSFIKEYSFQPQLTPPSAKKGNATDFALVIDCVHLLHSQSFDEAWLVTGDSDFAQLAMHLRVHGAEVICVSEKKLPVSFRNACTRVADCSLPDRKAETKKPVASPLTADAITVRRLLDHYGDLASKSRDGVYLSIFGKTLNEKYPGCKPLSGKLSTFLKKTGVFCVEGDKLHLTNSCADNSA